MIKKLAKKLANKNSAGKKSRTAKKTTSRSKTQTGKSKKRTTRKKTFGQQDLNVMIAEVAYSLYEQRGYAHGNDQADWYEAEKLVLNSRKA
ncbi:MAG: DUF2934 domain-containing protein [Candidatus Omnitrophica bacterium]|nr:DUF2934 domain-containing protein [Candidatus Omnitrophota bacterium]